MSKSHLHIVCDENYTLWFRSQSWSLNFTRKSLSSFSVPAYRCREITNLVADHNESTVNKKSNSKWLELLWLFLQAYLSSAVNVFDHCEFIKSKTFTHQLSSSGRRASNKRISKALASANLAFLPSSWFKTDFPDNLYTFVIFMYRKRKAATETDTSWATLYDIIKHLVRSLISPK